MINRATYSILLILLNLSFGGCNKKDLSPADYVSYCNDPGNGLKQEKTIQDIKYTLQYEPAEYLMAEKTGARDINKVQYKELGKQFSGLQYFVLRIEALNGEADPLKVGISDKQAYFDRIQYVSFEVQNDLKVLEGNDTLQCRIAHLERMYNIAPFVSLVLGFDMSPISAGSKIKDKVFIYSDKTFGTGTVRFVIRSKDIEQLPSIKISDR